MQLPCFGGVHLCENTNLAQIARANFVSMRPFETFFVTMWTNTLGFCLLNFSTCLIVDSSKAGELHPQATCYVYVLWLRNVVLKLAIVPCKVQHAMCVCRFFSNTQRRWWWSCRCSSRRWTTPSRRVVSRPCRICPGQCLLSHMTV